MCRGLTSCALELRKETLGRINIALPTAVCTHEHSAFGICSTICTSTAPANFASIQRGLLLILLKYHRAHLTRLTNSSGESVNKTDYHEQAHCEDTRSQISLQAICKPIVPAGAFLSRSVCRLPCAKLSCSTRFPTTSQGYDMIQNCQ